MDNRLDKAKLYLRDSESTLLKMGDARGMMGILNAVQSIAESNIVIAELLYDNKK